jgi:hypothetical protein
LWSTFETIVCAAEHTTYRAVLIVCYNSLHGRVSTGAETQQTNEDEQNIESDHYVSIDSLALLPAGALFLAAHLKVRHSPKDKTKPGVKERRHD